MISLDKFKLELSKRITTQQECLDLGSALQLAEYKVASIINSHRNDEHPCPMTANDLMKKRIQQLESKEEQIEELRKAFTKIGMEGEFNRVKKQEEEEEAARQQEALPGREAPPIQEGAGGDGASMFPCSNDGPPSGRDTPDSPSYAAIFSGDGGKSLRDRLNNPPTPLEPYPNKTNVGRAIIIQNDFTDHPVTELHLQGYIKDSADLQEVLKDIGFDDDIKVVRNETRDQILNDVRDFANKDYSDYTCVSCSVMSHGDEEYFKTKDGNISIRELTDCFRLDQLKGKPKLFFIQACRGNRREEAARAASGEPAAVGAETRGSENYPIEADIFEFYATPLGCMSYVHPDHGSTFVQCLCHVLDYFVHPNRQRKTLANTNIQEIATSINRMISEVVTAAYVGHPRYNIVKDYLQVSMVNSTLTKEFYFKYQ